MAKDKSEKAERKEKKEKRQSVDGVKKEKKDKSHKKDRKSVGDTTENLDAIEDANPGAVAVDADGDVVIDAPPTNGLVSADTPALAAMVPFANPLCDDKTGKKVLKTVKKAAKNKTLKRGVKEVVKAVRKTPTSDPSATNALPSGIVVLAADISPMDVISHIPVLCEDHNIPYVFLPSRAELGAAGSTKRPTSVVMVTPTAGKKDGKAEDGDEDWTDTFKDFHKLVMKQGQHVKI